MKRSILFLGLAIGFLSAGIVGCHSDGGKVVKGSKPSDPTAWTGAELSKDDSTSPTARPTSSRLQGGWSSEAREIEQSMGVSH